MRNAGEDRIPKWVLAQRQALPLDVKAAMSDTRIREWVNHWGGEVYVSFSGGKDSTVLLDLVRKVDPNVPAVFCDTGLEYPEVREFALSKADVVIRPKMSFKSVIERYGYPVPSKEQAQYIRQYRHTNSEKLRNLRWNSNNGSFGISEKWKMLCDAPFEVSEKCCEIMKKNPFAKYEKESGRKPFIGAMAAESSLRMQEYLRNGCNEFEGRRIKSKPIGFWTEQDILRYIVEHGLEIAGCYGEIVSDGGVFRTTREDRTGCMFCMFGVQHDGKPNRFQRMQRDYPRQYEYCMEKLGIRNVLEYIGIPYEYEPTLFDSTE